MVRAGASRMSSVSGLKARPHKAKRLPRSDPPKCFSALRTSTSFWHFVDRFHRVEQAQRQPGRSGAVQDGLHVLRKARSAVAGAGIEERIADAGVRADAFADFLDVPAEGLREVGDLVHERDPGGEHGVGSVLGQLGRAPRHHEHAVVVALERRVQLAHDAFGALVAGAEDDAVGLLEVVDRRSFLQELGIRDDRELDFAAAFRQRLADRFSTRSPVPTGTVLLSTMTA